MQPYHAHLDLRKWCSRPRVVRFLGICVVTCQIVCLYLFATLLDPLYAQIPRPSQHKMASGGSTWPHSGPKSAQVGPRRLHGGPQKCPGGRVLFPIFLKRLQIWPSRCSAPLWSACVGFGLAGARKGRRNIVCVFPNTCVSEISKDE